MRLQNVNARACGIRTLLGLIVLAVMAFVAVPALALPEGRHYEMVSPAYKGGYGIFGISATAGLEAVAPGGDSVAFSSAGVFAGAPSQHLFNAYLARRDPVTGWHTVSLDAPASKWPEAYSGVLDFSSTLESSLTFGKQAANRGAGEFDSSESEFLLHSTGAPDTPENFEAAGGVVTTPSPNVRINYIGGSSDLSHLIITPGEGDAVPLTPEAVGATGHHAPYDLVSHGGGARSLYLIAVNNEAEPKSIAPSCNTPVGTEIGKGSDFGAISASGQEIFFTVGEALGEPNCSNQLYVRLNDERTVEVSRPLGAGPFGGCGDGGKAGEVPGEVPCPGAASRASAEFVGASKDGSRVFFTTTAPLDEATDKDADNDLYMASIGCPEGAAECAASEREVTSLVQVSHDSTAGQAAEVQGVVAISPDGSHVYVVARGVLSEGLNVEGHAPVRGADNLYVYDTASDSPQPPAFIADLCSGPEFSGPVADQRCPADLEAGEGTEGKPLSDWHLWMGYAPEAQTTGTGGFLAFSSYAQLLPDDTDNAKEVYRYDVETGELQRISVGEDGYGANGNCSDAVGGRECDAAIQPGSLGLFASEHAELGSRAVSEDGSRIVFTSAGALSPAAVNGLVNAYEWHEGKVSLVSSGSDEEAVTHVVITPDGNDVFFVTTQGLLPQDTDGASDVYDARLGSGFPPVAATEGECSGDACQGPLTNPAPLLVPGSVSQAPGGNFSPPVPAVAVKPKAKPVKCKRGFVKKRGKCIEARAKKSKRARKSSRDRRAKS